MPRVARLDATGVVQHVIVRGIERRRIFRDAADRDWFLERLGKLLTGGAVSCYAWALMKNHVHLLVRTGDMDLPTLMRRLLTGYAGYFNRRYNRHGQLFQNRYKSIICQEDVYLKELVRYIHLNPLRAGQVKTLDSLKNYKYCGHGVLLGAQRCSWQQADYVLGLFEKRLSRAREQYDRYVADGVALGRRPELVGGGLVRSMGGWEAVKKMRRQGQERMKGDVRILGDGGFVEQVLARSEERLSRKQLLQHRGIDIDAVEQQAVALFDIDIEALRTSGRRKQVVAARSLAIYWAVRELGMAGTTLAKRYRLTQPAIVYAVQRGEKIAKENGYRLKVS